MSIARHIFIGDDGSDTQIGLDRNVDSESDIELNFTFSDSFCRKIHEYYKGAYDHECTNCFKCGR